MALTRPRQTQLRDSDYKNSCRVVTVSNITLSGGAPATVDGVNLQVADRILVTAQTDASKNGVYLVNTVGGGSNGTWQRTLDFNSNAVVTSGAMVPITEGTSYSNSLWRLTTADPITIDTTDLTFVNNILTDIVQDTTPQLGGNLDGQAYNITTTGTGTFGTMTDGTVSFSSGNITGVDTLRIDQSGTGLRMTNVGAFDNDGSDNFRIFATNDLQLKANGDSGGGLTIDATNQDVTITNDLRVSAGQFYYGGTAVTSTATELNLLDGVTGTLVTEAGTQTLTNKTLTSPTISNPTLTGTYTFTSDATTTPAITLTANSLNDGVGALRINGAQADIFLNPATATHTTVTFAVNSDQRLAFGMDNNSDFYITRRTGGSWYDDTFVIDRDTGLLSLGYGLSVAGNLTAGGNINTDPTATVVGTSATAVDTFSASTYRGAKYLVTVANSTNFDIVEALVVHNGTTATITVYGEVSTNTSLGDLTTDISTGNVRLLYTGGATGNSVKVFATYIT